MARKDTSLALLLLAQGHGTRKDCQRLVRDGRVEIGREEGGKVAWRTAADPEEVPDPHGLHFKVDGLELPCLKVMHLLLNKPANFECSHSPSHHRSIFELIPLPFVRRRVEAVGRLDADTTGLLLLSDSGDFIHHFTSPKRHVPKTYRVEAKHPVTAEQVARLETGVELRNGDGTTLPARVRLLGERACEITLSEGKYHQVKRMFAAVGNRVESIHRIAIGDLVLEESLPSGTWRLLREEDLARLGYRSA
jgi:16S rRNA pseudouridine516 synthase